jgi:hypothetical protein
MDWARGEIGTRLAAFVGPNFGSRIQVLSKGFLLDGLKLV